MASHLSVPIEEIDADLLKEKMEFSKPILSVLREMMDLSVIMNPLFALICISNVFGMYNIF